MSSFPGGFGGFDPNMFDNVPLFRELRRLMEWTGGPVNWDLARQTAEAIAGGAPTERTQIGFAAGTSSAQTSAQDSAGDLGEVVRTAEHWLDGVTELPATSGPVRRLSAVDWVRLASSSEGLGAYVEPVADGMGQALTQQLPEGLGAQGAGVEQAMRSMGAMLYGIQVGTIAGHMAGQLLGTYDLGLPTTEPSTIGTVGDAAARLAGDYELDAGEVLHWLALREAAHRRQYAGVPWLRQRLAELIGRFAADAELDPEGLMGAMGGGMGGDLSGLDPESLQAALEGGDFTVEPTPAQRATLDEIQALVSFAIGWVDVVVDAAGGPYLSTLGRIDEVVRRRRAEAGPGERFLTQLVGLDLRPADLRTGRAFCEAVIAARGQEGLDRAWRDASWLPRPAELVDASRWLVRMAAAELDEQ